MNQVEAMTGRLIRLLEVGKTISAASRLKIVAAITALQDLLASDGTPAVEAQRGQLLSEARQLLEADMSFSDRESEVRDAIRAKHGQGQNTWVYMVDCYDTSAVYSIQSGSGEGDSKTYQVSYSILDGQVTLGDPTEVEKVVSYVPVLTTEAAGAATKPVTKSEGDAGDFPASDYAFVPNAFKPSTWKLRLTATPGGEPDSGIVGAACAALGPGFMGNKVEIPTADLAGVKAKVRAAWKKANPDKKATDMPMGIAEAEAVEATDLDLLGDLVPLVEAKAVGADGATRVRVIAPGWGTSGYYSADMLKRDGPKVFVEGGQMYWDHPRASDEKDRPERSLRDLAGVLTSSATWEENGKAGPGLYADAKVFAPYQAPLNELAPHIGVSIRAAGRAKEGEAEGRTGKIIEAITSARSVDLVTMPGAGGKVLQLFEAARASALPDRQPQREVAQVTEEEARQLREANAALAADNARLKEGQLLREARDYCAEVLGAIQMPDLTRTRLVESLSAKPTVKDGALDRDAYKATIEEAAKAELDYLAKLTGKGEVKGLGTAPPSQAGTSSLKESYVALYRAQGMGQEQAEKLAALAAVG